MRRRLAAWLLMCVGLVAACDGVWPTRWTWFDDEGATSSTTEPALPKPLSGPAFRPAADEPGEPDRTSPSLAPVARVTTVDRWVDLLAQRISADHMADDRLLVYLGSLSARKYLELSSSPPWLLGEEIGGRRAGVLISQGASFDVPLDGPLSPKLHPPINEAPQLAMAITLRSLAPKQLVTVFWEERPLANLALSGGWERRTFSLPADLVRAGENRMRVYFRSAIDYREHRASVAVESIEVGPRDVIVAGPPTRLAAYEVTPDVDGRLQLQVEGGSSLVYHLEPPRRARLAIEVTGAGRLKVWASTDEDHLAGREPKRVFETAVRATRGRHTVDLTGYAGVPVRLELRIHGKHAVFRRLDVEARRTVPVDRRARSLRDVYVFAVEGARADLCTPGFVPRLPAIERFFAESMVFERAYALGAAAVPSHAGWMSSVVPPTHLTVRGTYVAGNQILLAEALDRAGYRSVGISANGDVNDSRGLTAGFGAFRHVLRTPSQTSPASAVVDLLLEQLGDDQFGNERGHKFGLVNLNDPQAPYVPPTSMLEGVVAPEDAPPRHLTHMWVGRVRLGKHEPSADEVAYVRRLYRGELQLVDRAFAQLLAALDQSTGEKAPIVVFVGVHGEEFLEHGGAGHGRTLHEESIHVPLAIRAPGLLAPGRVTAPVDLLDLTPTLADLLGLDAASTWQGESLVPLIDDPTPPPRLALSHLGDGSRAAIVGRHKLVLGPGRGRGAQQYVHLDAAPSPDDGSLGVGVRIVRNALAWHLWEEARWRRGRWGTGANLRPAFALDHGL